MSAHYLDTSALLRFILEGDRALGARLRRARRLFSSVVTLIEADRGLLRAFDQARVDRAALRQARTSLRSYRSALDLQAVTSGVVERARQAFPVEPVRTLDAIHLATALEWHDRIEPVTVISTDERVRSNARALGLTVVP